MVGSSPFKGKVIGSRFLTGDEVFNTFILSNHLAVGVSVHIPNLWEKDRGRLKYVDEWLTK